MSWRSLERWYPFGEGRHRIRAIGYDGREDLAAEIRPIGNDEWLIYTWPAPASNPSMEKTSFNGTLEDAKALAVTLAKLG
jgi:uncharacterized protein YndB with AHSA1/START domain